MLKTINMVQGLLSSRRFRRDNGCFFTEKSLKLTPKMTKFPKFSIFQSFYAFLVKFWRLRGLECFKGSTRKTLVVQWPFSRVYCIFLNENISNWHRNWQKTQNFPSFKVKFYAFFVKVSQTSWIGMFWRVNNEKIGTFRSL